MSARAPRSRTERNKRTLGAMPGGTGTSPSAAATGRPQAAPRPAARGGGGGGEPVKK